MSTDSTSPSTLVKKPLQWAHYSDPQRDRVQAIIAKMEEHGITDGQLTRKDNRSLGKSSTAWSQTRNGIYPSNPENVIVAAEKRLAWLLNPNAEGVIVRGKFAFVDWYFSKAVIKATAQALENASRWSEHGDAHEQALVVAALPAGWGKSRIAAQLSVKFDNSCVLEGDDTWRHGRAYFMASIAEALGVPCPHAKGWHKMTANHCHTAIIRHCRDHPGLIIVDEGLEGLKRATWVGNLFRDIANKTASAVVLLMLPENVKTMTDQLGVHAEQFKRRAEFLSAENGVSKSWAKRMAATILQASEVEAEAYGQYLAEEATRGGGLGMVADALTWLKAGRVSTPSAAVASWRKVHQLDKTPTSV